MQLKIEALFRSYAKEKHAESTRQKQSKNAKQLMCYKTARDTIAQL